MTTIASGLVLLSATAALASDVSVGTTGPDSVNQVSVNTTTNTSVSNNNSVTIVNENVQASVSGNANVSGNTNAGSATSGSVSNTNTTSTTVTINNPVGGMGGGGGTVTPPGGGGSTGGNGGAAGSVTSSGSDASASGGKGGDVQTLPHTGPLDFVDVSALRALYHPTSSVTPVQNAVKSANGVSWGLLLLAGLMTVGGALGSIGFARKQTAKV